MARNADRMMKNDATESARLLIPSSCMAVEPMDRPTMSLPTQSTMFIATPTDEYLMTALFLSLESISNRIH